MRKFQMQISTQADNQMQIKNVAASENCILTKVNLKFQNLSFNPMQNIILEQAKVDQTNLVLNSMEKIKPGFLLSLTCMFPESEETKILISQLTPPNEVPRQLGLENKMKKMGSLVLFSFLLPVWSLNCQKLSPFCNFLLMSVKNLRLLWQFMYMHQKALVSSFFQKWCWLLCYDLEFKRYQCLTLMNFVKFLLSQYFF